MRWAGASSGPPLPAGGMAPQDARVTADRSSYASRAVKTWSMFVRPQARIDDCSAAYVVSLDRCAPPCAQPAGGVRQPVRALVGKRQRQVVVDPHDEAIVVGQLEAGEAGDGVHLGPTDDHVALGLLSRTDDQDLGEQAVPSLAAQPFVWLIEQLEPHRRWECGVALGNLAPQGEESLTVGGGVDTQFVVVVDVDDDAEVELQRSDDHRVDCSEERWGDVKRCACRGVL